MNTLEKQISNIFKQQDRSGWKEVRFGDIANEIKETSLNLGLDGIQHVVGLEHITPHDIHIRNWGNIESSTTFTRKFSKGQVLFGRRRAYQRKAALAEFDGICSGDIIVLSANDEKIEPSLLPFIVHGEKFWEWAVSTSAGSLSPRTKFKHLAEFKFNLPPRAIQKKLSELLWKIDQLQEQTRQTAQNTEVLFKAFLKTLTLSIGARNAHPLKEVVELHYGKGLKESLRSGGEFDVVSSAGICGKHDQFIVKGPGVVVGRKGSVGEVTWVENNFWPIDTAYWVSLKNDDCDLRFFYYLLRSENLSRLSISTAIPGINRDDILSLKVRVPPHREQVVLRKKLDNLSNLSIQYAASLNSLRQLKASILNSLL